MCVWLIIAEGRFSRSWASSAVIYPAYIWRHGTSRKMALRYNYTNETGVTHWKMCWTITRWAIIQDCLKLDLIQLLVYYGNFIAAGVSLHPVQNNDRSGVQEEAADVGRTVQGIPQEIRLWSLRTHLRSSYNDLWPKLWIRLRAGHLKGRDSRSWDVLRFVQADYEAGIAAALQNGSIWM